MLAGGFFSNLYPTVTLFLYMLAQKDLPNVKKNNYRITERDYFWREKKNNIACILSGYSVWLHHYEKYSEWL